jgi:hypothetical protein
VKVFSSFQRVVFVFFPVFLGLLALIVATGLEVRGILQARDVNILLLAIMVLLLLLPYILIPIHLHRTNWLSAHHDYQAFHPAREVVPEEVWSHIRETVQSLSPCGVKVVAHFRKSGAVPGAMAFVTLMQTADQVTVAKVITVLATAKKRQIGQSTLAFLTELADGTEIVTANNTQPSHTPHPKKRTVLWLPDVRNPRELYEFHQRSMQRFSGSFNRYDLNGNPAEYMKQYSEAEVSHWVNKGYYKLDPATQVYRLTWKGAALIGWSYLWPIKPIRRAWRRYQTKKLLRKLEE